MSIWSSAIRRLDNLLSRFFFIVDGKRICVALLSSSCVTIVQYVPDARLISPRSPARISMFEITVPSGIAFKGRTLPTVSLALTPQYRNWPLKIPSAAMKDIFCFLYLYGSLKTTCAMGAPAGRYPCKKKQMTHVAQKNRLLFLCVSVCVCVCTCCCSSLTVALTL